MLINGFMRSISTEPTYNSEEKKFINFDKCGKFWNFKFLFKSPSSLPVAFSSPLPKHCMLHIFQVFKC